MVTMLKIGHEKCDRRENEVDPSLSLRESQKNSRTNYPSWFTFYRGRQINDHELSCMCTGIVLLIKSLI